MVQYTHWEYLSIVLAMYIGYAVGIQSRGGTGVWERSPDAYLACGQR